MIVIPQTYRSVYCFGNCSNKGEIFFKRNEPFDMRQLIIKVGASLSENTEKIVIKDSAGIQKYDPEYFISFENNLELQPDSIIYFQPYIPVRVSVFGKVLRPGSKTFAQDEPNNLIMLLTKCEGFQDNADRNIRIISPEGETTYVNYDELEDPAQFILEDGSYIIVDENVNQYATLIGDVKTPGIKYLRYKEISLLELLNQAGGVLDWDINTIIEINRVTGEKEVINTEKDPVALNDVQIYVGDIVYVMPSDRLKVYMYGEINSQKILTYYEGLTLFEAIMRCGGPKDTAYLKKILYYKGGINTYPQVIDISQIKWSKPTTPLYLEPGDVIYVPRSAMIDILRVTTFIGSMITFSTDAVDVYNGLTQSTVQLPLSSDTTDNDQ